MDAASHDRILARTSHLPQLLATALAAGVTAAEARLAGPAFHDMTRLAASDPDMWRDIFSANRENVTRAARSYLTELEALVRSLESGEDERLLAAMRRGSSAIESLEKRVPV
jgi:prephenate dehydrogenase